MYMYMKIDKLFKKKKKTYGLQINMLNIPKKKKLPVCQPF